MSSAEDERTPTPGARYTDTANGHRFVAMHGENVRYVAEDKEWVVWNGSYWERDLAGQAMELAKETALAIYDEVKEASRRGDEALARELTHWARRSLDVSRLRAMLVAASSDPVVVVSAQQMDTDRWLLNCPNGTVDLQTGELREARREDLNTKVAGVEYDPDTKCPQWETFVKWAMVDRDELVKFVQRALGMSLTGDASERLIFFLHGGGKNGKSQLLKAFRLILRDYGIRVESNLLQAAKFGRAAGSASPHIADLKGARFMTTSEVEDGTKLATALLKDLTGDETLRGRHLYKDTFEFRPEFTPWISANHKPTVPAGDQAIWDRLRLVPFDARVDDAEKVLDFGKVLVDREGPGILAWAVRGCLAWQQDGMTEPEAVMEATADYRNEMDTFSDWLETLRDTPSIAPGDRSPSILRERYNRWQRDNVDDGEPLTQRPFKAQMETHGWKLTKNATGRYWEPPAHPVTRVDYAELARLDALRWASMTGVERKEAESEAEAERDRERRAIWEAEEAEARRLASEA